MKINAKCPVCKKKKLFIQRWRYTDATLPSGAINSDKEICHYCHEEINATVLGKWAPRHYVRYARHLNDLMEKHGSLAGGVKELQASMNKEMPPTPLGALTNLFMSGYYKLKFKA